MRANAAVCGTRSKYTAGCHCDDCTAASTEYARQWRHARLATGRYRLLKGYWLPAKRPTP